MDTINKEERSDENEDRCMPSVVKEALTKRKETYSASSTY